MRNFLKEFNLFLIPMYGFALWCVISIALLSYNAEMYYNTQKLLDVDKKTLVGFGLKQTDLEKYKWAYMQQKDPSKVWALGSSRVLHFREEMFTSSFYNAGYTIRNMGDFKAFKQTFDQVDYPELVIIGLDQWLFNANRNQRISGRESSVWTDWDVWEFDLDLYKNLWIRVLDGRIRVQQDGNEEITYYGLNAVINGRGFRNDGSIDYGFDIDLLLNKDPDKLEAIKEDMEMSIASRSNRFESGDSIALQSLSELKSYLEYCKSLGIHVIAFLPPYADFTFDLMQESGDYMYIEQIYPTLEPLFDQMGFELYDFTRLESFGSNDSEILDGFHVAEIGYIKMILEKLRQNPDTRLHEYVNEYQLEEDLENPLNPLIVYEY